MDIQLTPPTFNEIEMMKRIDQWLLDCVIGCTKCNYQHKYKKSGLHKFNCIWICSLLLFFGIQFVDDIQYWTGPE